MEEEKGTGKAACLPNIQVAGKTGTAQVVAVERLEQEKQGGKETLVGNRYENHAWFVAYAPADDPRVAVAVLVEHGGHGGSVAGPLARRVIAAALTERQPRVAKSE